MGRILGFGTDLLRTARIGELVRRRGQSRLADRILTTDEQRALDSVVGQPAQERFLAVRWAAKEALYKALQPHYTPSWKDVSILASSSSPKPHVVFNANGPLAGAGLTAHLSVSHDGEYLIAGVVVERE